MTKKLETTLISSPNIKREEAKIIVDLFDAGLERFHLRKPNSSPSEISRILDAIPAKLHKQIVLHRCFELLEDYNLGGYHHKSDEPLKEVKGSVSRSIHKINELSVENDVMDYFFFGPVFHSISKKEHKPKIALGEIRKAISKLKNQKKKPLIFALGGIRRNKLSTIIETGFDGVALLGSVWGKPDPVIALQDFLKSLNKHYDFMDEEFKN